MKSTLSRLARRPSSFGSGGIKLECFSNLAYNNTMNKKDILANRIVAALLEDLKDNKRQGVDDGSFWDEIDPEIQADIREEWINIVRTILGAKI